MVFGRDGESLGCSTAYDGYGIDACDDSADPLCLFHSAATCTSERTLAGFGQRGVYNSGCLERVDARFFHTLQIELSAGGTVVLGKSLIEALERTSF